jgi:endothelin-converting enzyme/putative endopeptidase
MPFAQASFDFYSTRLRGVETMPPRWKQCVRAVDHDLGEALGQVFVQRTFAPQTKERAEEMTKAIEAAMRTRIHALPWMSETTKQAALGKLGTLVNKIGYPDRWRDYAALEVRRDDFFGNVERGRVFGEAADREDRPPGRSPSGTPDAAHGQRLLRRAAQHDQLPKRHPAAAAVRSDDGRRANPAAPARQSATSDPRLTTRPRVDAQGNLRDWWTKKDALEFGKRTACIVRQYSGYTIIDDVKINGRLTLGEDVADLGGAALAYMAWRAVTAGQALESRDGFTPDQRFFIGVAQ